MNPIKSSDRCLELCMCVVFMWPSFSLVFFFYYSSHETVCLKRRSVWFKKSGGVCHFLSGAIKKVVMFAASEGHQLPSVFISAHAGFSFSLNAETGSV